MNGSQPDLRRCILNDSDITYTEPVLMEVLAGARNYAERERLRDIVITARLLPFDAAADFESAAALHGIGKRHGLTVGTVDCMILSVAKRSKAVLLTRDRTQARLGEILGISVQLTS